MTSIELQSNTNIQLAPRTVKKKTKKKKQKKKTEVKGEHHICETVSEMCQLHILQTNRKPEEGK